MGSTMVTTVIGSHRSTLRFLAAVTASVAVAITAMTPASAAPVGEYTTYNLGAGGYGGNAIASGPDGNMWFTNNANNSIGRITPSGSVTYYAVPTSASLTSGAGLFAIAAGPDGNMWFTGFYSNVIGKVTPAGVVTTYPVPIADAHPLGITAGTDGNIWVTLDFANAIGRVTPAGAITLYPIPTPGSTGTTAITASASCVMCGYQITAGPLDSLWFTIPAADLVGRITVDGVLSTFPVATVTAPSTMTTNATIGAITAGADGNLWIAQNADGKITRMTATGVTTDFDLPAATAQPSAITPGPDNSMWIAEFGSGALASFDVPGVKGTMSIKQYPIPTGSSLPTSAATGADGSVWFTNIVNPAPGTTTLQVGRVGTGVGALVSARVSGAPKAGSPLTCTYVNKHGWRIVKTRYQWLRGGTAIANQTAKKFTPRSADKGAKVSCRVSLTFSTALNQIGTTSPAVSVQR